jgi:transposase
MKFIQGQNRDQAHLFPTSLNDAIEDDNVVQSVDAFIESMDSGDWKFSLPIFLKNPAFRLFLTEI